jgi:hypothetical protein
MARTTSNVPPPQQANGLPAHQIFANLADSDDDEPPELLDADDGDQVGYEAAPPAPQPVAVPAANNIAAAAPAAPSTPEPAAAPAAAQVPAAFDAAPAVANGGAAPLANGLAGRGLPAGNGPLAGDALPAAGVGDFEDDGSTSDGMDDMPALLDADDDDEYEMLNDMGDDIAEPAGAASPTPPAPTTPAATAALPAAASSQRSLDEASNLPPAAPPATPAAAASPAAAAANGQPADAASRAADQPEAAAVAAAPAAAAAAPAAAAAAADDDDVSDDNEDVPELIDADNEADNDSLVGMETGETSNEQEDDPPVVPAPAEAAPKAAAAAASSKQAAAPPKADPAPAAAAAAQDPAAAAAAAEASKQQQDKGKKQSAAAAADEGSSSVAPKQAAAAARLGVVAAAATKLSAEKAAFGGNSAGEAELIAEEIRKSDAAEAAAAEKKKKQEEQSKAASAAAKAAAAEQKRKEEEAKKKAADEVSCVQFASDPKPFYCSCAGRSAVARLGHWGICRVSKCRGVTAGHCIREVGDVPEVEHVCVPLGVCWCFQAGSRKECEDSGCRCKSRMQLMLRRHSSDCQWLCGVCCCMPLWVTPTECVGLSATCCIVCVCACLLRFLCKGCRGCKSTLRDAGAHTIWLGEVLVMRGMQGAIVIWFAYARSCRLLTCTCLHHSAVSSSSCCRQISNWELLADVSQAFVVCKCALLRCCSG